MLLLLLALETDTDWDLWDLDVNKQLVPLGALLHLFDVVLVQRAGHIEAALTLARFLSLALVRFLGIGRGLLKSNDGINWFKISLNIMKTLSIYCMKHAKSE